MRRPFLITMSVSILVLSACAMESGEMASASSLAASSPSPSNFTQAVSAPGRDEADAKLDVSRKPAEVLAFMGLESGDAVLDIFAGGGYYSEILGRAVGPTGSVIAVNPPQFVSSNAAKAKWADVTGRQPNVSLVAAQLYEYAPDAETLDFAMMHLIYHDLYWESEQYKVKRMDPAAFLTKLYTGMKPGGIVAVIDHVGGAGETRAVVEKTHRINPDVVRADFARAGFVLEAESNMFTNPADDLDKNVFDMAVRGKTDRFTMRFRKPN
ncbi:class I SAM-dependent methyltransferase [Parasphingorhabdus sp.]|uniref:class I SAM-dependent methyltransferase n=1 Tax=Parasphingorhabdus sp. TaxID=2709688 RepID=UPI003D274067